MFFTFSGLAEKVTGAAAAAARTLAGDSSLTGTKPDEDTMAIPDDGEIRLSMMPLLPPPLLLLPTPLPPPLVGEDGGSDLTNTEEVSVLVAATTALEADTAAIGLQTSISKKIY